MSPVHIGPRAGMKRDDEESEEVQAPPHFAPSEEWLAAFRLQATETLVLLAVEYANTLAAGIGSEKPQDKRYPRTVVLRALADTQLGILRWDHTTPLKAIARPFRRQMPVLRDSAAFLAKRGLS